MSKQLKALIVDDERLARMELIKMLDDHSEINIIGEADCVESAIEKIEELQPDIIFLDIQMPGQSGFDLAVRITPEIKIIFVTAYDEYAIRAFEINALDYLLKPVYPVRLSNTIDRILSDRVSTQQASALEKFKINDRIFISSNNRIRFLKIADMVAINSAGDYSEIIDKEALKNLVPKSMKEWESRLPEDQFIRIHRATIINLNYINRIEDWFNHSYKVYMNNLKDPFVISRRYASRLKDKFR